MPCLHPAVHHHFHGSAPLQPTCMGALRAAGFLQQAALQGADTTACSTRLRVSCGGKKMGLSVICKLISFDLIPRGCFFYLPEADFG